jgi:hypothetical protein
MGNNMRNNLKTFRLFVSSTFSDFQVEREVLQTQIFPEIKNYCSSKGYTFQSIDLRWGVSNEAQLDQKALDICIKEVQSCKTYDSPNFLIMLGDRYGWVPLPNIIEKKEFESILDNSPDYEKNNLLDWYYEDKNQLPSSYILKQREYEYENFDNWLEVESKLRKIFQKAVTNLDGKLKNKYFTSATESEAIEGIIQYFGKTEYQQKLLQLIPELDQVDHKHIFGFFRDIDSKSIIDEKFVSIDYDKAKKFKQKVKSQLIDENSLNITTFQISKGKLDKAYLDNFKSSVIIFLRNQVDEQISRNTQKQYSSLELEKLKQQLFRDKKLENFLGQDEILEDIQNYICNNVNEPLLIYGPSGIGKSSIMAKSIFDTLKISHSKIIYRFIGATPNSTTTKDVLISIFEELDIAFIDEDIQVNQRNQLLSDIDREENSFVKFSNSVNEKLLDVQDEIVIFIDAVDQLTNSDQFLWLPNKLPSNIKIIISAIKDSNYKEDSKYFDILNGKIMNTVQVEPFNQPIKLLEALLFQEYRTLQDSQKDFFLECYNRIKTPLYISIASTQIKFWKSNIHNLSLASSQQAIVEEFINNLTSIHYHDQFLVRKVLGYIYASKDGLSEYEILELLNTDKEFIKSVAPDTWHINTTQELPLAIWVRLYNQLKPFLKIQNQAGQILLYFFHREFIGIVGNQPNQKVEHVSAILAVQKIIEKNQDKEFDNNRWGKLYAILLAEFYLQYEDENKIKEFCQTVKKIDNEKWLFELIKYLNLNGKSLITNNHYLRALAFRKTANIVLDILSKASVKWLYLCVKSSHNVASTFCHLDQEKEILEAIEIEERNLSMIDNFSEKDRVESVQTLKHFYIESQNEFDFKDNVISFSTFLWREAYLQIISVLASCYNKEGRIEDAIKLEALSFTIANSVIKKDPSYIEPFLIHSTNLAESLGCNNEKTKAIELLEIVLKLVEDQYDENTGYLIEHYARIIYNLSVLLAESAPKRSKELQEKNIDILSTLSHQNPNRYSSDLLKANITQISTKINRGDVDNVEQYYYNFTKIFDNIENNKNVELIEEKSNELLIKSFEYYKEGKLEQSINYLELNERIIEYVYNQDQDYWGKFYVQKLIAIAKVLKDRNSNDEAKRFQEKSLKICKYYFNDYFSDNKNDWGELYTKALNNISSTNKAMALYAEALISDKLNIDISCQLYKVDPIKWHKAYYYALLNISDTYRLLGNKSESNRCLKQSYDIKAETFISSPEQFENKATQLLKDYDNALKTENIKELLRSLFYLEEFLKVCKTLYEKDAKWTAPYVEMLNKVAQGYTTCPTPQSGKKIRQYINESLQITKPLAKEYPDQWGHVYKNVIKNKRNLQKILYGTYIFVSMPIITVIAIIYFIFR